MNWHHYFNGSQMAVIAFSLSSIALFLLICQAVLLLRVLLRTKQHWYHFFPLVLAGIITIWLYQQLVQTQAYIQDIWSHILPRGPLTYYQTIFGWIDQAFTLCLLQVGGILALAVGLFLLQRIVYPRIEHLSVWRFIRSGLFPQKANSQEKRLTL